MKDTRVRFAPSPTGFLHVGGARTLLFNYLYAKKTGGTLVLRIEDTDQARSTAEAEKMILEDVRKLNLLPNESPQLGGNSGPYRQSERLKIYGEYARKLLDSDRAYYCFCSDEELSQKRELALKLGKTPHYDGKCAKIPLDQAKQKQKNGEKAGIRFRAIQKDYILKDQVKGDVSFASGMVGDFFITRTPRENESEIAEGIGMPVYNFCCVIDDALMGITHVIRGDDHLSNTARQLQIYDAFQFPVPVFAHIAMVLGADKQKLSKRNGDSSVHEYMAQGYLPEALLNFLALLGWWPGAELKPKSGHPEILSLDEMIHGFELQGLQKSPAVFDVQKLKWMNGQYLRQLPLEEITERVRPFWDAKLAEMEASLVEDAKIMGDSFLSGWVETLRGECQLLSEIPEKIQSFYTLNVEDAARILLLDSTSDVVVEALRNSVQNLPDRIVATDVEVLQKAVGEKTGVKGKNLFMPIRAAMTGKTHGPELKKILPLLGKKRVVASMESIQRAIRT